jgi:hypothetical protein
LTASHSTARCIPAKAARVKGSLRGSWAEAHIFGLRQAVQSLEHYQGLIAECDRQIQALLAQTRRLGSPCGWRRSPAGRDRSADRFAGPLRLVRLRPGQLLRPQRLQLHQAGLVRYLRLPVGDAGDQHRVADGGGPPRALAAIHLPGFSFLWPNDFCKKISLRRHSTAGCLHCKKPILKLYT